MPRVHSHVLAVGLCLAAAACSKPAQTPAASSEQPPAASSLGATPAGNELSAADTAALLATLPAPYNTGDVDNGRAKFALCMACHTLVPGAPNMTGPNLHGVFGRKVGSAPGFAYSSALKSQDFNWDAAHLDKWLAGPAKDVPGTKMTFVGLPNPQDRIDVIAYLKVATF